MAERVETSDEWITERTGIRQRHFAAPHETAPSWGRKPRAARWNRPGMAAEQVGAIIVATSTPDQAFPATAVHIQAALGAKNAFGFDLAAACSGFIYGLSVADAMIRAGQVKSVLVIGSEVYSRILNFNGSRHLRAVWRRRWRGAAACATIAADGAGPALHPSACRWPPGRHPLCRRRRRPAR